MKKPSAASLKKVTAENLAGLGADRLAEILVEVAQTRVDLKRRLRMELAADLGPAHLIPEVDRRLNAFETSRGQVTWRQKPAFVRDLDALRGLIDRLARSEPDAATERLWRLLATAPQVDKRLRSAEPSVDAVYLRAAADLGRGLAGRDPYLSATALVDAARAAPKLWASWLPATLADLPRTTAAVALEQASLANLAAPGWALVLRAFADAAQDTEAFGETFGAPARQTPSVAVEIARRYFALGDVAAAGDALRAAAPKPSGLRKRLPPPDFAWETAWIEYLERSGQLTLRPCGGPRLNGPSMSHAPRRSPRLYRNSRTLRPRPGLSPTPRDTQTSRPVSRP